MEDSKHLVGCRVQRGRIRLYTATETAEACSRVDCVTWRKNKKYTLFLKVVDTITQHFKTYLVNKQWRAVDSIKHFEKD